MQIRANQSTRLWSFPEEWDRAISSRGYTSMAHEGLDGGAGGAGAGGAGGHAGAGGGYGKAADGGRQRDAGRRGGFFRAAHLERYATNTDRSAGNNPKPSRRLQQMVAPLARREGGYKVKEICRLAGTTPSEAFRAEGFRGLSCGEDLICFNYASGKCPHPGCSNAHLWAEELPQGWDSSVQRRLELGVKRMLQDGGGQDRRLDGPPEKRQRGGNRGGGHWTPPNGNPPEGPRYGPPGHGPQGYGRYGPPNGRPW